MHYITWYNIEAELLGKSSGPWFVGRASDALHGNGSQRKTRNNTQQPKTRALVSWLPPPNTQGV